jgi:signal peptidase I
MEMVSFVLLFIGGSAVIALITVVLMRCFLIVVTVENMSMVPTLEAGDRVLMIRHWPTRWLRKGQIVLIAPGRGVGAEPRLLTATPYIKRIVALGGETFTISNTDIPVHNYSFNYKINHEQNQQVLHIPTGHLFVQGDSAQSVDSRTWGPLPLQSIRGVLLLKLPRKASVYAFQRMSSIDLLVNQAAPQFIAQTLRGETVTPVNFNGHAILFLFLTPRAISTHAALLAQLTATGVTLVVVSTAGQEVTRAWIGRLPSSIPILVAPRTSNSFLDDYHIFATPAFCFVNEHSVVEANGLIGPNVESWKTQIGSLVGQQLTVPEDGSAELWRG